MKKLDLGSQDAHQGPQNLMKGGKFYDIEYLQNECFYIKERKDTTNWEIMPNDTLTILNKKCVAAKSVGMLAWYAPSMPQKSGPADCYGLPGLVLAVFNNRFHNI